MNKKKIEITAGIEIHQQLDVGEKLFCRCPAILRSEKPDFTIKRRLHKVPGETGEIDNAVEYESNLNKEFTYELYKDSNCLIEIDEEPPLMINEEGLNEVIKIALLLNCEIYQNSQIMRKTVINGSNTSGFQRTILVAHSGWIKINSRKIGINTIAIEEDSARIIKKEENQTTYRLDRLGIPLIEITTNPELKRAEEIKECALKIGELLRSCRIKRGIGTIRQDLNISIKGHDRVEIKGFQDPKIMIRTVENEILRQIEEKKKGRKKGEVRNALKNGKTEFLRPLPGKSRMYPETDLPLLHIRKERIDKLKKILPKLKNEIKLELRNKGLNEELIKLILSKKDFLDEFKTLIKIYKKDANLVAKMISLWRQELATKTKKDFNAIKEMINERALEEILEKVKEKKIEKSQIKEIMYNIINKKSLSEALKIEKIQDDKIEEDLIKLIKEKPGLRENAYMGIIMKKFGNKVNAKKTMEIIKRIISKV